MWNPFASAPKPAVPKSEDGGYVAPDRSSRAKCYESRDNFFDCLDKNDIIDAVKHDAEARKKCSKEVEAYETDCARSWIKYFKEKRVMEYNRDRVIDKIKKEDAEMRDQQRGKKSSGGLFG